MLAERHKDLFRVYFHYFRRYWPMIVFRKPKACNKPSRRYAAHIYSASSLGRFIRFRLKSTGAQPLFHVVVDFARRQPHWAGKHFARAAGTAIRGISVSSEKLRVICDCFFPV